MKKERPHIFYDQFRAYVETGAWLPSTASPSHPAYKAGMQRVLRVLSASQIRILDPDVVRFVVDLANKAGKLPVPYIPYPRYPMWIEFGGDTLLGDSVTQYKAIWAFPAQDRAGYIHFDLITLDGQAKSLFAREDGTDWSYEQGGACDVQTCARAHQTTPGEPYKIHSGEARSLMLQDCVCAGAGWQWTQLLFLIGHLMRLPRSTIQETMTRRDLPLPRDIYKRQQVAAENKRYPRYVTLSLTQPMVVSARPSSKQASAFSSNSATDYLEAQPVAGHVKVLIPGEGKPWKDLHIFHVESYERRGKPGENPTRYIIQP